MGKRKHDDLGRRMKEYYEGVSKTRLMRRTPVAIRIDGKAFHTYTKGFDKPFDGILMAAMQETMLFLCENIQGCVIGYTQSDEITLILADYQTLTTSAWYDYEVQKLCSMSASMATMAFNRAMAKARDEYERRLSERGDAKADELEYLEVLGRACRKGALFDSRCFNIPVEEVTNLLYWRQLDAKKNSIQLLGRAHFSAKKLHGKHGGEIREMLAQRCGIDWNELPIPARRGSACIKGERGWDVDFNVPEFKDAGREYVEKRIRFEG